LSEIERKRLLDLFGDIKAREGIMIGTFVRQIILKNKYFGTIAEHKL
jgi:hypothetical protein